MNDWDLAIFAAIARTGGIGRAAAELNTVQSNVTTRMRLLEAELGQALLLRQPRGVSLTSAGERLLPYAVKIGDLMRQAKAAAQDDGAPRGPLRIASLETTAALRLPPILLAFTRAFPQVELSLRTGATADLVADVLDRTLDGAFVTGPLDHPELAATVAFEEELVLVTAEGLSLDRLAKVADLKIVMFKRGCSYRQRLETILATRGIAPPRVLEFGALEAIIGCVAAGLGVALLPRAILVGARSVTLHELPPHEARVETLFIRRNDAHLSSALDAFMGLVGAPTPLALAAE